MLRVGDFNTGLPSFFSPLRNWLRCVGVIIEERSDVFQQKEVEQAGMTAYKFIVALLRCLDIQIHIAADLADRDIFLTVTSLGLFYRCLVRASPLAKCRSLPLLAQISRHASKSICSIYVKLSDIFIWSALTWLVSG